jgi:hypothetical protein
MARAKFDTRGAVSYEILISDASGVNEYIKVHASTSTDAMQTVKQYVAAHPFDNRQLVLRWHRKSDGCSGYLNPDGETSPTGQTWTALSYSHKRDLSTIPN